MALDLPTSRHGRGTRQAEAIGVHPGEVARFLDECWQGWRDGTPDTDYILFSPAGSSQVYMIGPAHSVPGVLEIDGDLYYSQAWL